MSDVIQKQKELYKNHLEFLGYQVEYDPDDEQEMKISRNGIRTFMRVFSKGLRSFRVYGISQRAKSEKLAFLEFVNSSNEKRIAKIYTGDDWLAIELWYFCAYEKISFGEFINTVDDESSKFIDDALEKGFLN